MPRGHFRADDAGPNEPVYDEHIGDPLDEAAQALDDSVNEIREAVKWLFTDSASAQSIERSRAAFDAGRAALETFVGLAVD
jgi:hypothetical protein